MNSFDTAKHPSALNICTMMERLGFTPTAGIAPRFASMFISAFQNCQNCPAIEKCGDWLADTAAALKGAPAFCPNADFFGELTSDPLAHWTEHNQCDA